MPDTEGLEGTPKRRRVTRACDRCHLRGLKCVPGPTAMPCMPCQSFGLACTYNRPVKRRGPPPRSQANAGGSVTQLPRPYTLAAQRASADWEYREIADHQAVLDLAELYYRVVHPILLYFHWPTFSADLHSKRYTQDRSFFATTMAVCATASARLRAGAPLPPSSPTFDRIVIPSSEVFYSACLDSLPILTAGHADFNFMRTEALLGMLCLQYDGLDGCHTHLHRYLAMCSEIGFSNERNWPSNLTEIEVQERRRLFWQQYHFDVYLAVTFGSPVRQRGAQCNVLYPAEVYDDEDITPFGLLPRTGSAVSFIRGWNFVTDLYRILEHVSERMQTRQIHGEDPNCHVSHIVADHNVSTKDRLHKDAILATMQRLFEGLPADLKHARPMSGAVCQDRYGFQVANIMISMTTVKMVLAGSEDHGVAQRCAIAGELLDSLSTIPTIYIQATSTAMLHHLAGVGHLLASVIHSPLSQWMYLQVRSALLAITGLVRSLETALNSAIDISSKLRGHVQRIDQYMTHALKKEEGHVLHSALPADLLDGPSQRDSHWINQGATDELNRESSFPSSTSPMIPGLEPHTLLDIQSLSDDPSTSTVAADLLPQLQFNDEGFPNWSFDLSHGNAFDFLGRAHGDETSDSVGWHGVDD